MTVRLILFLISITPVVLFGQDDSTSQRTSVLRGTILEERLQQPIPKARITVKNTKFGAIASETGEYRIERIPVGRYIITVSANGYTTASQEVIVSSARQSVLDFQLREKLVSGDSITVTASRSLEAINRVAAISVTPFSIEDVNRYAAAFQDPSRMAANFAGVLGRGTFENYIVVRGGSPIELLWRLDGIEIPNPNHFGKNGTTGGLVSAFSSQMLGNSDFLTGAFPAEYGTRLSAVFDLHTRNGNTETFEGNAEISFTGMQGLIEGPAFGDRSSFILNYRHSTIGFLRELGLIEGDNLPDFDDAMLKGRFPIGQNDQIELTGLWGAASIESENSNEDELGAGSGMLVGGVDWQHIYSEGFISHLKVNRVENYFRERFGSDPETVTAGYTTAETKWSYIPNTVHGIDLGAVFQRATYDVENFNGLYFADTSVGFNLYRLYMNWNWHIIPELVFNAGLFSQFIELNHSHSYEPRLSLSWSPYEEHTFSAAFGVHRQPQPLEFTEALHYVLGYTFRPFQDIMIKAEGYVKRYSDVPIHRSTLDSYSYLNEGYAGRIEFNDLINTGRGHSYGAELSIFKHYTSGYYITTTASFVRQLFTGSDGIEHYGAFDNRYIINILSGFDIPLSNSSTLTLSEKFMIAGGGMYTPIDLAASQQAGEEIYDSTRAYGARNPAYVRLDINAEFRFNWSSSALTVILSVLNALNIDNVLDRYYSGYYDAIRERYDLPRLPILGLRYEF